MINTLIVGGGPAGVAPLIAASRSDALPQILSDGVGIVERGAHLGAGRIGRYAIKSDSTGKTLVSCILETRDPALAALRGHPIVAAVAAYGDAAVPLTLVNDLMMVIGAALRAVLRATDNPVFLGYEAISVARDEDAGCWRTTLRHLADDTEHSVSSRFVVLATGGHQPLAAIEDRIIGGKPLLSGYAEKLLPSDEALTQMGLDAIGDRLAAGRGRVAIVGSSSSAMACANAVLRTTYGQGLDAGAVTLLHRRPLRVFYPSAAAALADGYDEFGDDDICPISGFVFRLSGFRLEARELLMAVRGIGGRPPEHRLRLHQVGAEPDPIAVQILDESDVIVTALGYRPRALRVLDATGAAIPLLADEPGSPPLVDDACRVLDRHGMPIEGVLGIGLASGFFARGVVGGERSFKGQSNSLWQWQNAVGGLIAQRIQESPMARARRAERIAVGA